MRLNFRPQIYEDESLGGYVHRLANANGFDSVTAFADGLGIRRQKLDNHVFTPSAIEILSEMTDISESELLRHSAAEYEKVSFMNGLLKNRFRYCSLCAKEKLYHRQLWILRPLTACLKHKVHLNSKCHNCDTNISLTSLVTGHCNKCYADLLTVSPTVIDEQLEQYEFERSFVNKLNGKNTDCIGNLSIEKYMLLATGSFHLLEGLDSFFGHRTKNQPISPKERLPIRKYRIRKFSLDV
ncbi:TniQ family protein [Cohnella ginsengisoli]|uniref:TniQ family protein n=1 Tax=Cohnella ginsengisoli TaxID=425004 RepID=A0A9X4QKY4_9BACL|nr:TniQ family protein [Cohnella ginsengisoli]MDG0789935.1 TniQ family protein [Cohnella ginsengisoli]